MENHENPRKSMIIHEIHEHVWDIFVLKKEHTWLCSIFWTNKRLTYLSSKEKSIVQTKKIEIYVLGETWTSDSKTHVKVTIFMKTWNDPTVITHSLPQAASHEPIMKVRFLTKVLKSVFPKVWDSFWEQYSTIQWSSCGKFEENSILTRLERSPAPPQNGYSTPCRDSG